MTLPEFIEKGGPEGLAMAMDVCPQTIINWRLCRSYPTRLQALKLVKEVAPGVLTFDSIYGDHGPVMYKRGRKKG